MISGKYEKIDFEQAKRLSKLAKNWCKLKVAIQQRDLVLLKLHWIYDIL